MSSFAAIRQELEGRGVLLCWALSKPKGSEGSPEHAAEREDQHMEIVLSQTVQLYQIGLGSKLLANKLCLRTVYAIRGG